jgi:hypothetical protein
VCCAERRRHQTNRPDRQHSAPISKIALALALVAETRNIVDSAMAVCRAHAERPLTCVDNHFRADAHMDPLMTASIYTDYVHDLKATLDDLYERPDRYQTFDLHIELAMGDALLVYQTRRQKGQTDTIAYARTPKGNTQVSPATAYQRVSAFLTMQNHIALTGEPMIGLNAEYPHAVISFEHRAKGASFKSSMKMIFVGVNDADDASRYRAITKEPAAIVTTRPHHSVRLWEWK